jgi:lipopolysaccharide/colanic/teichoic acid biosynthesis glycosyltransferase
MTEGRVPHERRWASAFKRVLDVVGACVGLVVLSPLFVTLALAVRFSSPGPILFRQVRVGRGGADFVLLKFRSMTLRSGTEAGTFHPGDRSRTTWIGRFLRSTKLDELPQLWNVLRGDMSLVGPRPEVRKWVNAYPVRWARVHTMRPGITDRAAIYYRDEECLLAGAADAEAVYRDQILPRKLEYYEEYVRSWSVPDDCVILLRTVGAVVARLGVARSSATARPQNLASEGP